MSLLDLTQHDIFRRSHTNTNNTSQLVTACWTDASLSQLWAWLSNFNQRQGFEKCNRNKVRRGGRYSCNNIPQGPPRWLKINVCHVVKCRRDKTGGFWILQAPVNRHKTAMIGQTDSRDKPMHLSVSHNQLSLDSVAVNVGIEPDSFSLMWQLIKMSALAIPGDRWSSWQKGKFLYEPNNNQILHLWPRVKVQKIGTYDYTIEDVTTTCIIIEQHGLSKYSKKEAMFTWINITTIWISHKCCKTNKLRWMRSFMFEINLRWVVLMASLSWPA